MLNKVIRYFLENRLVTFLVLITFIGWGIVTAPFGWNTGFLPSDPVPVDAIPDLGENQQIVFADWPGRSPQDIEDQITYHYFAVGYSRCEVGAVYLHVWLCQHLHHLR